jgi:hypothetical protein
MLTKFQKLPLEIQRLLHSIAPMAAKVSTKLSVEDSTNDRLESKAAACERNPYSTHQSQENPCEELCAPAV